jgi:hypothetical protein
VSSGGQIRPESMEMSDGRSLPGVPRLLPEASLGSACGLVPWVARPPTADAVRSLCGPVESYIARSGARLVICDARSLAADVPTLDALARLHLTGSRLGCRIRIRGASEALIELAAFLAFDRVLAFQPSGVQPRGQPEQREDPLRVQEEDDPADLTVGDVEHLE